MTDGHIGDAAELHAIGALDARETAAVAHHLSTCDACRTRVAEAERVAAALALTLPNRGLPSLALATRLHATLSASRVRPPLGFIGAVAAVALAFLGLGGVTLAQHARLVDEDAARDALLNSHFVHVAVTPRSPPDITAKVIFARDGSWVYVVAARRDGPLRAFARGRTDVTLGDLVASGTTESLLVRPPKPIGTLVLERASGVAGIANLACVPTVAFAACSIP